MTLVEAANFVQIRHWLREEPPHSMKGNPATTFRLADDTKTILVDPQDLDKLIRIGARMSLKIEASLTLFLCENTNVFACKPSDMPGIPHEITKHYFTIKAEAMPVQQRLHCFDEERQKAIGKELARLMAVASSRKCNTPIDWPISS